jgi:hypothetical protein
LAFAVHSIAGSAIDADPDDDTSSASGSWTHAGSLESLPHAAIVFAGSSVPTSIVPCIVIGTHMRSRVSST